jgi:hypothetical protein
MTDPQTAAAGEAPVPPPCLPGPAVPVLIPAAGDGTDAGPGSLQLPGPAPEGVLAADALDGDFREGQPAGHEPAAGPGFTFHPFSECPGESACPVHGETMPGVSTALAGGPGRRRELLEPRAPAPGPEGRPGRCAFCGSTQGPMFDAGYALYCSDGQRSDPACAGRRFPPGWLAGAETAQVQE